MEHIRLLKASFFPASLSVSLYPNFERVADCDVSTQVILPNRNEIESSATKGSVDNNVRRDIQNVVLLRPS